MIVQILSKSGTKKKSFKKGKFAISINDQGRVGYYVRKLKYFLKEKHPTLKEECSLYREKSLKAAKDGNYIVFGIGENFDYTVMSGSSFLENPAIGKKTTILDLETDFKLIKQTVKRYVYKNYTPKSPFKKKYRKQCPFASYNPPTAACTLRSARPVTVCKPVTCVPAPRPCKRDWNMQVNGRYVLLTNGSRYETRTITKVGCRETVSIDGTRYTVRRDSLGQGIVVQ